MKLLVPILLTLNQFVNAGHDIPNEQARYNKLKSILNKELNLDEFFAKGEQNQNNILNSADVEADAEIQEKLDIEKREQASGSGGRNYRKKNYCFSQCAVNKANRETCGNIDKNSGLPTWKTPAQCKSQGCCYDNNDKQCYQPAKTFCPRPRCEAVPIEERTTCLPTFAENSKLTVNQCLKLAPGCCYDVKTNFCFKKAEVQCPVETYKENVIDKEQICGWRHISKPQCLSNVGCCWNDKANYCVKAVKNETKVLTSFIEEQLETEIAEEVENPVEDKIIEEVAQELTSNLTFEELEENYEEMVNNYVSNQLSEIKEQNKIAFNATHKCPLSEDLYKTQVCLDTTDEIECAAENCCMVEINQGMKGCFKPISKMDNVYDEAAAADEEDGEHSFISGLNPNPNNEYIKIDQPTHLKNQQNLLNLFLATKEAENRCGSSYNNESQKDQYRKCILFMMPNLLDLLENLTNNKVTMETQYQSDVNLSNTLRSICFFKYDSFDLCKILALSGRPLKKDPSQSVFGSLDLLNLGMTPEIIQDILETQFGKDDMKSILMLSSQNNESLESVITKIALIKNSEVLETEMMIRLADGVKEANENAPVVSVNENCQETLLINNLLPNYSQYSFLRSNAKTFTDKDSCEAAGHCWTEYNLDSILAEIYGEDKYLTSEWTSVYAFSRQMDRILGQKQAGVFDSDCVMKAESSMFKVMAMGV